MGNDWGNIESGVDPKSQMISMSADKWNSRNIGLLAKFDDRREEKLRVSMIIIANIRKI